MTAAPRRVVVVLGMHRSGTSLAARAVNVLGVELGDDLWGPRADNPTGFWEDREMVAFNKRLLERSGMAWHSLAPGDGAGAPEGLAQEGADLVESRLERHGTWGFKDPRTARTLPFWKGVFRSLGVPASYVLTVRHPVNVARSLARRDGLPELHSHLMWLEHMVWALKGTAGESRCLVDYDELVEQPVAQLSRLARALGIAITPEMEAGIAAFAGEFVAEGLRHNRAPADAPDSSVPAIAARLYGLARDVALDKSSEAVLAEALAGAGRQLAEWQPVCEALDQAEGRLASARETIVQRDYWLGELNARIERLTQEKAEVEQLAREHGKRLQAFASEIGQLKKTVQGLEAKVQGLDAAAHSREELVKGLEITVRSREELVREHGARLQAMNADLTDVTQRLAQREAELSRIKGHWYWRIARLIIR
jgi:hypothetical protein